MMEVELMTTTTLYKYVESELFKMSHDQEIVDSQGNLVFFDDDFQVMTKIMTYDDDVTYIIDELFKNVELNELVHDFHFKKAFFYRFVNRQINRQTIESFRFELISTFLTYQEHINKVYEDLEKYIQGVSESKTISDTHSDDSSEQNSKSNSKQNDTQENENKTNDTSEQKNNQNTTGNTTTDNRNAQSSLPQSNVQLDVNNTIMKTADSNDISRNKQSNSQDSTNNTNSKSNSNSTGRTSGNSVIENIGNNTHKGQSNSHLDSQTMNKTYKLDDLLKTTNVLDDIFNIFDKRLFMQFW